MSATAPLPDRLGVSHRFRAALAASASTILLSTNLTASASAAPAPSPADTAPASTDTVSPISVVTVPTATLVETRISFPPLSVTSDQYEGLVFADIVALALDDGVEVGSYSFASRAELRSDASYMAVDPVKTLEDTPASNHAKARWVVENSSIPDAFAGRPGVAVWEDRPAESLAPDGQISAFQAAYLRYALGAFLIEGDVPATETPDQRLVDQDEKSPSPTAPPKLSIHPNTVSDAEHTFTVRTGDTGLVSLPLEGSEEVKLPHGDEEPEESLFVPFLGTFLGAIVLIALALIGIGAAFVAAASFRRR